MGKKKKKNSKKSSAKKQETTESSSESKAVKETKEPKVKGAKVKPEEPPTGINRIPYWLRHEKGYSDMVAGIIVLLAGGLFIVVLSYILILVWPAR